MPLRLVLDEYDRIDLPITHRLLEAWRLRLDRDSDLHTVVLSEHVATCGVDGLTRCLDWGLQPLTGKQMRCATTNYSRIEGDAQWRRTRYKGSMTEFIDRFGDVFKARRGRRSRFGEALNTPEED